MGTDIVSLEANNLDAWIKNSKVLADASLLPKAYRENPANILLAIQTGAPLGFGALESINGIHIIEGKPSMSADLIQAAVRKAGHRLRVEATDTSAKATIYRADDPDYAFVAEWTIERAKSAGLAGKDVWRKYPSAMLRSRAITEVARMGAADALHGVIYTPEELGATVTPTGEVVFDADSAETVEAEVQPADLPDADKWRHAIDTAENQDQLKNLWDRGEREQLLGHVFEDGTRLGHYILEARKRFTEVK